MFSPDAPLDPPDQIFDEPWQAQALALADILTRAGVFTAEAWASTLGAALATAERNGAPDTLDTYYTAVVSSLETLTTQSTTLSPDDLQTRRKAWIDAYRRTPHGQPVTLDPAETQTGPD